MFGFFKKKDKTEKYKKVLEKYQDKIDASIKPYIEINASKSSNLSPLQSKFGGIPYLKDKQDYPKSSKGEFLYLLAQINFAEVPNIVPFPNKGILQFWITPNDLGIDFEDLTQKDTFRAIYYPEVSPDNLVTDFDFLPELEADALPFDGDCEYALNFMPKEMPAIITDYQFEEIFGEYDEELFDAHAETYLFEGHRIGGYANFAQDDPRGYTQKLADKNILLLQIDTDDKNNIMWGDCGVGNFFINEEDLKNCDFSNVMYNWDSC
jgi:uncharacterized protein YwqG